MTNHVYYCEQWRIQNLALESVRAPPLVLRGQFLLNYNNFIHSEDTISEHMAIFNKNICNSFNIYGIALFFIYISLIFQIFL